MPHNSSSEKTKYSWKTIKIYLGLAWKNHPILCLLSFLQQISTILLSVAIPYFTSKALASIISGATDSFHNNLISLALASIAAALCNLVGFVATIRLNAHLNRHATNMAFDHLLTRSIGFHANNSGGKLVSNAIEFGVSAGRVIIDFISMGLTPYILTSIIGISITMSQSLEIGLALALIYILIASLSLIDSYLKSGMRAKRKIAQDVATAGLSDNILNSSTIKAFASEDLEIARNDQLQKNLLALRLRDWTHVGISGTLRMTILLILQLAFIWVLSKTIMNDPSKLGIGIYAFTYSLSMLNKLFDLGTLIRNGEESLLSASTMTKYLLEPPEVTDQTDAKNLKITNGAIKVDHLDFRYPDQPDEPIFDGLSVEIPPGQRVGLVGKSGGGKTTLVRLLMRFNDITGGSIAIDGQNIAEVTQKSLRHEISYVPQEPMLFHRTLLENITYAKPTATEQQVIQAAKQANAWEFISELPEGLNTIVGERGVKLSGGQRQRIAIARAILKDAPILILDEATSALDSESERLIQDSLEVLMKNRTSIVIAHRLSTIAKMDRIIVLDNGEIIEDGSHEELLKTNGTYARLWEHQSGGFIR